MKYLATILLLASFNTFAADPWTSDDTEREVAFVAIHVLNYGQQRYIATHPASYPYMTGRTGSDVDVIFLSTGAAQYFIAKALPEEWRGTFQIVTIGFNVGQVARNLSIGANFKF